MGKWLAISLALHLGLICLLIWSDEIDFLFVKKDLLRQQASGVIEFNAVYKPTDTMMRKGDDKKDLPPPDVTIPPKSEKEPELVTKATKKKKPKKEEKKPSLKDFKNVFDKFRKEAQDEKRPIPKIDNFPMTQKGEKGATGTGGRSQRILSPAELALQSAMRKHFELPDARNLRKKFPDLNGYIQVSLVGSGNQFSIRSLKVLESTGFAMLDRSCEDAIRKALDVESFSADVVAELNGKESGVICSP